MLLTIDNLHVSFPVGLSAVQALRHVSISLAKNSKTAVIGETGCGKSVLAAAIAGLLPYNAMVKGSITWENKALTPTTLAAIRGKDLSLIPQNPHGSLNPVLSAGFQVRESVLRALPALSAQSAYDHVLALLSQVGFDSPAAIYKSYPHQLSGGMAQRILLAAAMAGRPKLVIADEPTKGLDLATRNQNVLLLHRTFAASALLLITHDIEVAATCHSVVVMYAGEIVETGMAEAVLTQPQHPYTTQLLNSHPAQGLTPIPGSPPDMSRLPGGCRFAARCARFLQLDGAGRQGCLLDHPALLARTTYAAVRCSHA